MYLPRSYYCPASIENNGSIDNETDSQALGIKPTEQPDEIFDELIIHVCHGKVLEVKDDAEIVYHVFLATLTRQLLET